MRSLGILSLQGEVVQVVASEDGKFNSHADELPGWEHYEFSKMVMIRRMR